MRRGWEANLHDVVELAKRLRIDTIHGPSADTITKTSTPFFNCVVAIISTIHCNPHLVYILSEINTSTSAECEIGEPVRFVRLHLPFRQHVCDKGALTKPLFFAMSSDTPVARRLSSVKHIIIVCSGKGGVGKSSVSAQLALSLHASSPTARIGILDVDLTGPSIPRMLGVDSRAVVQSSEGWVPVYADGAEARLAVMSVGFLLKNREDSVVWRGPKKNAMIRQFLSDVRWGELDYLVIDTPPGTCTAFYKRLATLTFECRHIGRTPLAARAHGSRT
jgi:hypothetical protein